ncbi:MAG: hypothetical protein E6I59_18195 [Chloroflexi bacterium]|nr:MAG: hypothetical protein E6J11_10750 [Chloroflexota bacterium]TME57538.1 MAG: hypothetical protein E6I59_18195 [Chloroflexota bacterium]
MSCRLLILFITIRSPLSLVKKKGVPISLHNYQQGLPRRIETLGMCLDSDQPWALHI